jgi:hypothetical protein
MAENNGDRSKEEFRGSKRQGQRQLPFLRKQFGERLQRRKRKCYQFQSQSPEIVSRDQGKGKGGLTEEPAPEALDARLDAEAFALEIAPLAEEPTPAALDEAEEAAPESC